MIRQLDKHLVNKIAAGEVVERPLSVIKELTENSIDAGASSLTLEIKEGGTSLIRVTDNGSGIPAEQVHMAFAQHATSKIRDIEDLNNIATLGFRGEALASISSVSHMEMITKTTGALLGTRIELHGGTVVAQQELGCAEGTTINVSNLFFNVPARLKFLKKPSTEAGYVTDLVQRLALGYPGLAFRYISNGQPMLATNGNGDLRTVIYHIYGKDAARGLIEINDENDNIVSGYIARPEFSRGSRSGENFFINGRYIKSELLQNAVEEVFTNKSRLMTGRFPLFVLHLQVAADQVDVNVHPAKMEVRFANEREMYNRISEAVGKALAGAELVPSVSVSMNKPTTKPRITEPKTSSKSKPPQYVEPKPTPPLAPTFVPLPHSPPLPSADADPFPVAFNFAEERIADTPKPQIQIKPEASNEASRDYNIIGQIFNTYWLAVRGEELYLIDQHAAHERVLYEKMWNRIENEPAVSQPLLEAQSLKLSPKELEMVREHKNMLEGFGFEIEISEDKVKLLSLPSLISETELFIEIVGKMEQSGGNSVSPARFVKEELAMAACKSAIKAKDNIITAEALSLIHRMLSLENPYNCPHGRPTMVKMTKQEIERMFKRT